MKKFFSKILRIVLFFFFSTYAILLVATSLPYGYARLPKITWLHEQKIQKINDTVYIGTFPDEVMLKRLKQKGITRIVSFLDSRIPFVRDFANYEKKLCAQHHIAYSNYSLFSIQNVAQFTEFLRQVNGSDAVVFIHEFFLSERLNFVAKVLSNHAEQTPQTPDNQPAVK